MKESPLTPIADTFTLEVFFARFRLYTAKLQEAEMKLSGPCICYIVDLFAVFLSVLSDKIHKI